MGNSPEVFKQPHVWEAEGSSRIPFWAYTDEAIYKKEGRTILVKRKLIAENEKMSCDPENEDRKKEFYKVLQQDIRSQIFYE
jgi:hypothetical protein